jgi:hypothetical protein
MPSATEVGKAKPKLPKILSAVRGRMKPDRDKDPVPSSTEQDHPSITGLEKTDSVLPIIHTTEVKKADRGRSARGQSAHTKAYRDQAPKWSPQSSTTSEASKIFIQPVKKRLERIDPLPSNKHATIGADYQAYLSETEISSTSISSASKLEVSYKPEVKISISESDGMPKVEPSQSSLVAWSTEYEVTPPDKEVLSLYPSSNEEWEDLEDEVTVSGRREAADIETLYPVTFATNKPFLY